MDNAFWNQRYGVDEYIYGTDPNEFLRDEVTRIPKGKVVCLAEGEGRNAVWLAQRGYQVTAMDFSAQGLKKAERLARERGVELSLVVADLATYDLGRDAWDGIVAIWAHVPPAVRRRVLAQVPHALKPGGAFVFEAYRPEQIPLQTGGPKDPTLLPTLAMLKDELVGLDLVIARDTDRVVAEGHGHDGKSATVQVLGIRRA